MHRAARGLVPRTLEGAFRRAREKLEPSEGRLGFDIEAAEAFTALAASFFQLLVGKSNACAKFFGCGDFVRQLVEVKWFSLIFSEKSWAVGASGKSPLRRIG